MPRYVHVKHSFKAIHIDTMPKCLGGMYQMMNTTNDLLPV